MAARPLLLVLILHELGMRSALTAQLAMLGADVLTADAFDDAGLARAVRRTAILVTDAQALASHPGGYAALAADARWHRVIVIQDDAGGGPEPIARIARVNAAAEIVALAESWRRAL